jgi:acetoacetyl-CoA synthetase
VSKPALWTPTPARYGASTMAQFERFLADTRGLTFDDYNAMWRWSVEDLETFWRAIWEFFEIPAAVAPEKMLVKRQLPGMEWGAGAQLNYADNLLKHAQTRPNDPALIVQSETFGRVEMTWATLRNQVASVASQLRKMGVGQGDRVVAILPNTQTALIAFLATVSLGAIWSLCASDMGHVAILDRFKQIAPKVLIAQDGYVHAGKMVDRTKVLAQINAGLPSVAAFVTLPVVGALPEGHINWEDITGDSVDYTSTKVPFEHPLWIVYSSGTTGNPKPIVQGHGGILLEGSKQSLHQDISAKDRYCWLTSSGWIMWNSQWMAMSQGATIAIFDGAVNHPDLKVLWQFVARERVSYFGAGAAYFSTCMKAGIVPRDTVDLAALRSLGATGSPLSGRIVTVPSRARMSAFNCGR